MAIDPNILLRGIVPNLTETVGQAQQIGQNIRQAPARNRLLEAQTQQQEQATGQDLAIGINSIVGDSTAEQITPDIFANSARALQSLGVNLTSQETQFNPENVNKLVSLSQAGKRFRQEKRSAGQTGFQTNAPIITEDKSGQKFFTSLQTDRATGKQRATSVPISGAITDRLGLTAGDQVTQAQQIEIGKATGRDIGAAETAGLAAQTAAQRAAAVEEAKVDVELTAAPEVAAASAEAVRLADQARSQQKASDEAFKQAGGLDSQLRSIDKAISALDKGAKSGIVQGRLPAFDKATEQLRSASKTLGIDVINSATFGALSATELQLALSTAVPDNLDEDELRSFLVDKRNATKKLKNEIQDMGRFLSKKGNTVDKWLGLQDEKREKAGIAPESQATGRADSQLPSVTNQAEFDAIPPGGFFIEDGVRQRKL